MACGGVQGSAGCQPSVRFLFIYRFRHYWGALLQGMVGSWHYACRGSGSVGHHRGLPTGAPQQGPNIGNSSRAPCIEDPSQGRCVGPPTTIKHAIQLGMRINQYLRLCLQINGPPRAKHPGPEPLARLPASGPGLGSEARAPGPVARSPGPGAWSRGPCPRARPGAQARARGPGPRLGPRARARGPGSALLPATPLNFAGARAGIRQIYGHS